LPREKFWPPVIRRCCSARGPGLVIVDAAVSDGRRMDILLDACPLPLAVGLIQARQLRLPHAPLVDSVHCLPRHLQHLKKSTVGCSLGFLDPVAQISVIGAWLSIRCRSPRYFLQRTRQDSATRDPSRALTICRVRISPRISPDPKYPLAFRRTSWAGGVRSACGPRWAERSG